MKRVFIALLLALPILLVGCVQKESLSDVPANVFGRYEELRKDNRAGAVEVCSKDGEKIYRVYAGRNIKHYFDSSGDLIYYKDNRLDPHESGTKRDWFGLICTRIKTF